MEDKDYMHFLNGVFVGIFGGLFITSIWDMSLSVGADPWHIGKDLMFAILSLLILAGFVKRHKHKAVGIYDLNFIIFVLLLITIAIFLGAFFIPEITTIILGILSWFVFIDLIKS